MTDWEMISEQIHQAMEAVDKAHAASNALRKQPSAATLDVFQEQMGKLCDHLQALKYRMNHEDIVFSDEVVDAMSKIFTGHEAPYRKSPRDKEDVKS
jgi:hypothetical protein